MEYYVIYDLHDNIIALCENLEELSIFTGRKKKHLKFRFKNKDIVYFLYEIRNNHKTYGKIYKFYDFPIIKKDTISHEI